MFFFHSSSRSRVFPGMIASDSCSRNVGMDFFILFPFPNFGNIFFHSLPVPEFQEWPFPIPSCSQTAGMELSIPVPKLPKVLPVHPCFLGYFLDLINFPGQTVDFCLKHVLEIPKAMTLSFNLAYLDPILVHPFC